MRGICKVRITTSQEGAMVKPSTFSELLSSYSHEPDLAIFDCGIYTREST